MLSERLVLALVLILALGVGNAWADEADANTPDDRSQPSNIEGWDVDEDEDEKGWTWFGMGYAARQALSSSGDTSAGGATGSTSVVSGPKKGGPRKGR
ncbi:MAG: hypothetical protein QNJ78_09930 [Gammaproteobacteria bacterium]|nr:hypothetical protein [Gammaproteobacteria bacterium]